MNDNEKIINKVKNLLALAADGNNDDESQTAFALAQKMMLKNRLTMADVQSESDDPKHIGYGQATSFKRLIWWEKQLAAIISKNFRVEFIINSRLEVGDRTRKSAIKFLGFDEDVELAKEMFYLAYDAFNLYSKRFTKAISKDDMKQAGLSKHDLTKNYQLGFIYGLADKFDSQVEHMSDSMALMVQTPTAVTEYLNKLDLKTDKPRPVHYYHNTAAMDKGYSEGNAIDLSKKTLDKQMQTW